MFKKEMLKIAITGHVDHGKSTLIGSLLLETKTLPSQKIQELKRISKELGKDAELAYLVDQLKEERENNITIDTTEIFLKTPHREYCIIDTPGHLEFIKNMLTGSSHAEAAILIIDAFEGLQEQTRRHAFLLRLLSIKDVIVVINKMDLAGFEEKKFLTLKEEISAFLKRIDLNPISCVPISAKKSINITKQSPEMKWYKGPTVLKAMENIKSPQESTQQPLQFPIQDVYSFKNDNVFVGRLTSGKIQKGQTVTILPSNKKAAIVRILFSFGEEKKTAVTGDSIGVVLSSDIAAKRGDIILDENPDSKATQQFNGRLFWLSDSPLKKGAQVNLRCSTQESLCRIQQIKQRIDPSSLEVLEENAEQLHQNEIGILDVQIDTPFVMKNFTGTEELGRYIIERDDCPQGVGTVVMKTTA